MVIFNCPKCDDIFCRKRDRDDHVERLHKRVKRKGNDAYGKCPRCKYLFRKEKLRTHVCYFRRKRSYVCFCARVFTCTSNLKRHQRSYLCGSQYEGVNRMAYHEKSRRDRSIARKRFDIGQKRKYLDVGLSRHLSCGPVNIIRADQQKKWELRETLLDLIPKELVSRLYDRRHYSKARSKVLKIIPKAFGSIARRYNELMDEFHLNSVEVACSGIKYVPSSWKVRRWRMQVRAKLKTEFSVELGLLTSKKEQWELKLFAQWMYNLHNMTFKTADYKHVLTPAQLCLRLNINMHSLAATMSQYNICYEDLMNMDQVRLQATYDVGQAKYLSERGDNTSHARAPKTKTAGFTVFLTTSPGNDVFPLVLVRKSKTANVLSEIISSEGYECHILNYQKGWADTRTCVYWAQNCLPDKDSKFLSLRGAEPDKRPIAQRNKLRILIVDQTSFHKHIGFRLQCYLKGIIVHVLMGHTSVYGNPNVMFFHVFATPDI